MYIFMYKPLRSHAHSPEEVPLGLGESCMNGESVEMDSYIGSVSTLVVRSNICRKK